MNLLDIMHRASCGCRAVPVLLFDEEGRAAHLYSGGETGAVVERVEFRSIRNENRAHFSIAVGLSKGKTGRDCASDYRTGAVSFFPLQTTRSLWKGAEAPSKHQRWERIAGEAARQCQGVPPQVCPVRSLDELLQGESFDQILVAWVGEESQTSLELLCREECVGGKILLLFGPEGGWTDEGSIQLRVVAARVSLWGLAF